MPRFIKWMQNIAVPRPEPESKSLPLTSLSGLALGEWRQECGHRGLDPIGTAPSCLVEERSWVG